MEISTLIPPVVNLVATWQDVRFAKPLVGWRELAAYLESKSPQSNRSPDCLRLAFWAGKIPLKAVRYGQKIVFDRKSADALVKDGVSTPARRGAK